MKNILKILILLFSNIILGQEGVIVSYKTYDKVPNGTYLKDIEGQLDTFTGTYIGHWNNKKFTLVLQKMEHITNTAINGDYYYEDRMVGKYEIVSELDNSVLYSTMDVTEYPDYPIINIGGVYNGELEFDFFDSDERCNNKMELRLYKMTTQAGVTTVRYWGRSGQFASMKPECMFVIQETIPKVLPYGFLTLTKVN
jgi:hypothetical protein